MGLQASNLIWVDMEMTGLEPDRDRILEIATIVTDSDLNILAEGPVLAIHQPAEVLALMDDWCVRTHTNSGLVDRVVASTVSEEQAEEIIIDFLKQWAPAGISPMCGNSIGQDRRFMHRYMPRLEKFFHYRNVDVSTIKELGRRWSPDMVSAFQKQGTHLALDDIRESIGELRHYRDYFFRIPSTKA